MNWICVLFDRFGPYHWARLNAAGTMVRTLGMELSAETSEYGWHKVGGESTFRRVTLFPESDGRLAPTQELTRRLQATLDEYEPAAVAIPGWSDKGALAALLWCLKNGKPAIVMSESQASDDARQWPKEALKRRVVGMCATGLTGGTTQANYLATLGMPRPHIFTGYDVVDNDYFSRESDVARQNADGLRARLNLPEKYFLASNRFIAKKNLHRLLEAYSGYRQLAGSDGWKLVLLGDGPLKPQVLAQVEQLGLGKDVLLRGFKQYDELPAYYGLAGAFVHASTTEQWGLVVNEAMACGLPVLISDRCGCAPDLVFNGRNGVTFDPFHVQALIQLLLDMAGKKFDLKAMGEASREIVARWSPKTFAANLLRAAETALQLPARKMSFLNQAVLQALLRCQ
jgi:1,2-diacylglycerol 3-alpha-glucosyltransferase